jgi:hypothetical protein
VYGDPRATELLNERVVGLLLSEDSDHVHTVTCGALTFCQRNDDPFQAPDARRRGDMHYRQRFLTQRTHLRPSRPYLYRRTHGRNTFQERPVGISAWIRVITLPIGDSLSEQPECRLSEAP